MRNVGASAACDLQTNPGCQNAFVAGWDDHTRLIGGGGSGGSGWVCLPNADGPLLEEKGRGREMGVVTRGLSQVDRPYLPTYLATTTMRKGIASRIFCTRVDGLTAHVCECDSTSVRRGEVEVRGRYGPRARARQHPCLQYPTKRLQFKGTINKGTANNVGLSFVLWQRHIIEWDTNTTLFLSGSTKTFVICAR